MLYPLEQQEQEHGCTKEGCKCSDGKNDRGHNGSADEICQDKQHCTGNCRAGNQVAIIIAHKSAYDMGSNQSYKTDNAYKRYSNCSQQRTDPHADQQRIGA